MAIKPGTLPRIDTPPVDYDKLSNEMERWLTDIADTLNQAMTQIETLLPP